MNGPGPPAEGATAGVAGGGPALNIGPGGGSGAPLRPQAAKLTAAPSSAVANATARASLFNRVRVNITPNDPHATIPTSHPP